MKVKFRDATSHAQGAKDRTPRMWQAHVAGIRLVVTRHIDFAKDVWVAKTHPAILDTVPLHSRDIAAAKVEAVELLARRCNAIVKACGTRTV